MPFNRWEEGLGLFNVHTFSTAFLFQPLSCFLSGFIDLIVMVLDCVLHKMALRLRTLMAIGLFVTMVAASGSNVARVRNCPHSIPSIDLISQGVDITRVDLVPINLAKINERGFKDPIIDLSCSEENRREFFGREIDVFDQVSIDI